MERVLPTACVLLPVIAATAVAHSPILIVPGVQGSQLFMKELECSSFFNICPWRSLWAGISLCTSMNTTMEQLSFVYNSTTKSFQNRPEFEIKASGFGETCKVEYLFANPIETSCDLQLPLGEYFHTFVEHFTSRGYVRGKTIRSAPYDWRFAPDQLQTSGYYSNVQTLIEEMYKDGGNTKITLVAHSYGCPVTMYFLNNIASQFWKEKYVNAFVTIAGTWAGESVAVKSEISGDVGMSLSFLEICDSNIAHIFRNATRTFPCTASMLPKPSVWDDHVIVSTPKRTYTANDYQALFNDMGYPQGFDLYSGIASVNEEFSPPNVPVYCFYGTGVKTPESFVYGSGFPDTDPTMVVYGDGDGTVNQISAKVCLKWKSQQQQPFMSREFSGAKHGNILLHSDVLSAIDSVVLGGLPEELTALLTSSHNSEM